MVNIATGTVEDLRAARREEYGKYVAAEEIYIDGVLAFGIGFPVPVSHTEEYPQLLEPDAEGKLPVITAGEYLKAQEEKAQAAEAAAVAEPPSAAGARTAWVRYARAQGAPETDLAAVKDGGLGRNELAEKYGAEGN